MLDFPASPTNGQKFPQPAVSGVPVYTWDGEKWTTAGGEIVTATPATALPLINATPAVVGVTLKYAREDHVHPTDTTRASVGITESALAYSGMQINGGMEVSQERGAAATTVDGSYIVDGWKLHFSGTMVPQSAQATAGLFQGFPNYINIVVLTAQASITGSNHTMAPQKIEGYRIRGLRWGTSGAQSITIGFWSAHNRPGVYSVAVNNNGSTRSYVSTYTHAAADVPQYNVITVPGDTTGTWANDNTPGISLAFTMAAGPTLTASTANSWLAGNYIAAPGQINGIASTSDSFRLTGVTVLPGTQAPTAAQSPNIMRPFDQELATCKRYYQRYVNVTVDTSLGAVNYFFPEMRVTPTITGGGSGFTIGTINTQVVQFFQPTRAFQTLVFDARL